MQPILYAQRWLVRALTRSLGLGDFLSSIAGSSITVLLHFHPEWEDSAKDVIWQIPIFGMLGAILWRLLIAPYELWREDQAAANAPIPIPAEAAIHVAEMLKKASEGMRKFDDPIIISKEIVAQAKGVASLSLEVHRAKPEGPETVLTVEPGKLVLTNLGDSSIWLAGTKLGNEQKQIDENPRQIPIGHFYYLFTDRLETWAVRKFGQNAKSLIPLEFCLFDADKTTKWIAKCTVFAVISNGSVTFSPQNLGTEQRDW